ncbi:MAG: nickel pincer cofactor biosynthesis protein LarC [Candidatus Bipolaricaulota bacterium]
MTNKREVLFLEPFSGISGDMFLSSLFDLGLEFEWFAELLSEGSPMDIELETWSDSRASVTGTRFRVEDSGDNIARNLDDVLSLLEVWDLPTKVLSTSKKMFEKLAAVEAEIHGVSKSEVHFHEVGAVDSIVDIVGAALAIWRLSPETIHSAPVNLGKGTVTTKHGIMPVPAPATAELLRGEGVPTYSRGIEAELTTPTGALILVTFVDNFTRPPMEVHKIGYGLGAKDFEGYGNYLRTNLGKTIAGERNGKESFDGKITVLETNIDDMNPEFYSSLEDKLLEAGALDVFKTSVQMKKNRPGSQLTVICNTEDEQLLGRIVFRETTTLGIRSYEVRRRELDREIFEVETNYGSVEVKVGYLNGEPITCSPEFDSCCQVADANGLPVKTVYQGALAAAERKNFGKK